MENVPRCSLCGGHLAESLHASISLLDTLEKANAFWLNAYNFFMIAHLLQERPDGKLASFITEGMGRCAWDRPATETSSGHRGLECSPYGRPGIIFETGAKETVVDKKFTYLVCVALALFFLQGIVHGNELVVGGFARLDPAQGLPEDWEPMTFSKIENHTTYDLIRDNQQTVVKAHSNNAASGLIRQVRVDPREYPWLQWSWKIEHVVEKGDVRTKEGDDYAARIYVAFAFEPEQASLWQRMRHRTASALTDREVPGTALSYIWANKAYQGTIFPNPFSQETMMVVLQSGNARSNQWINEKRNIVEDYQRAFGKEPPEIIGVGLMTDTDNTGEETAAYYGDIIFLKKN